MVYRALENHRSVVLHGVMLACDIDMERFKGLSGRRLWSEESDKVSFLYVLIIWAALAAIKAALY